jgi:hypothetical protein
MSGKAALLVALQSTMTTKLSFALPHAMKSLLHYIDSKRNRANQIKIIDNAQK